MGRVAPGGGCAYLPAMRSAIAATLLLALAACGETSSAGDAAEARQPPALAGHFRAASNTARTITGDVSLERGGLLFASGVVLFTRTLEPRRGGDVMARGGDSYAAAALGPGDLRVELRRVVEQTVPANRTGLCGEERVRFVALTYEERATSVTLLVFSGEEAPGPMATQSRLCATFSYGAPDGARTREGIVL